MFHPNKINSKDITVTNTGLPYQFAFSSDWSPIPLTDDELIVSENLLSKESSKGSCKTWCASFLPGKEFTQEEMLKEFQIAILKDLNNIRMPIVWSPGKPPMRPLSPLLSKIVLGNFAHEFEKRGHRFVSYTDDCNIYVKNPGAGKRVTKRMLLGVSFF